MNLDFSSSDLKKIAMTGTAAAALGIVYKVAEIFMRSSTGTPPVDFEPQVEALHMERDLFNLYVQLAEYRSYHEVAFRQTVKTADELVLRMSMIANKSILPTQHDNQQAWGFYQDASKQILRIKNSALKENPRAAAIIENIHRKIHDQLQRCYMNVVKSLR